MTWIPLFLQASNILSFLHPGCISIYKKELNVIDLSISSRLSRNWGLISSLTWHTEGMIWAKSINFLSFLRVKLQTPMSRTRFSSISFSISLQTPSMSNSNTSPGFGGLLAPSFRWKGQWIYENHMYQINYNTYPSWFHSIYSYITMSWKTESWSASLTEQSPGHWSGYYKVQIKVVELQLLKGVVEGSPNPVRGQISAPVPTTKTIQNTEESSRMQRIYATPDHENIRSMIISRVLLVISCITITWKWQRDLSSWPRPASLTGEPLRPDEMKAMACIKIFWPNPSMVDRLNWEEKVRLIIERGQERPPPELHTARQYRCVCNHPASLL